MRKIYLLFLILSVTGIKMNAQWVLENSAFTTAGRGIASMAAVNDTVVWASGIDTATMTHQSFNSLTRTTNGGTTWTQVTVTAASGFDISNVAAISKDTAWVAMGDPLNGGGRIYRTNDGGATWTQQNSSGFAGGSGYADEIYFFDKNNGVCVGDSNAGNWEIYTTANGGTTWNRVPIGNIPPNQLGEFGNNNSFAVVGSTIWFGTSNGRVYWSTNMGVNWSATSASGSSGITCIAFKDANNGIAEGGGNLVGTTNGGASWAGIPASVSVPDGWMCYVPGTTAGFVCSSYGLGNRGTMFSSDGGLTWSTIDTLDHGAVAFVNSGTGWCGGFNTSAVLGGMYKWSNALGIAPLAEPAISLTVYPNPVVQSAEVILNSFPKEAWNFTLYDLSGKTVIETGVTGNHYTLEATGLPGGIYLYRATQSGKLLQSGKIMVR